MKCALCGAEWLDQSRLGHICFVHLGHTGCPLALTQAMSTSMVEAINAAIEQAKMRVNMHDTGPVMSDSWEVTFRKERV